MQETKKTRLSEKTKAVLFALSLGLIVALTVGYLVQRDFVVDEAELQHTRLTVEVISAEPFGTKTRFKAKILYPETDVDFIYVVPDLIDIPYKKVFGDSESYKYAGVTLTLDQAHHSVGKIVRGILYYDDTNLTQKLVEKGLAKVTANDPELKKLEFAAAQDQKGIWKPQTSSDDGTDFFLGLMMGTMLAQ